MQTWAWILVGVGIGLAAAALVAAVTAAVRRARTRRELRRDFGVEYDRTIADAPTRRAAEADLRERKQRRELLEIRPLDARSAQRYAREWRALQARFVDTPDTSVSEADRLVQQLMNERGYPMSEFEARADLISVDHPNVVENYRRAHSISLADEAGDASTEDLRQALVHYRALFAELLDTDGGTSVPATGRHDVQEVH